MRTRNLVHLLGLAVVLCPLIAPFAVAADQPSEYSVLLGKLKAGDTTIDFARLRLSYMESPERKSRRDTAESEKAMFEEVNAKNYHKALEHAQKVLDSEYVNMDAHFIAFVSNRELENTDKAKFHQSVFRGLVKSILDSGDGKSPEKAWVVIAVHEEYVVLRLLGFRPSSQSEREENGHHYDVMKVKDAKTDEDATFYFNVDIPFKHYLN